MIRKLRNNPKDTFDGEKKTESSSSQRAIFSEISFIICLAYIIYVKSVKSQMQNKMSPVMGAQVFPENLIRTPIQ